MDTGNAAHGPDRQAAPAPARGNKITFDDAVKRLRRPGHGSWRPRLRARTTTAAATARAPLHHRQLSRLVDAARPATRPSGSSGRSTAVPTRSASIEHSRAAPTVADLGARFLKDHLPRVRPATQLDYQQQIARRHPARARRMKVAAVSHADVDAFHHKISARAPTHANRVLACLSKMFSLAVRWGWRSDNPCKGVERNQETQAAPLPDRRRAGAAHQGAGRAARPGAANAVRLLLLTGARRGELLAARWADFDLDAGVWIKPGATTKQKTTHRVPLSAAACRLLAEMRAHADVEYGSSPPAAAVIASTSTPPGCTAKAADIPDVRLHDLRHTYASVLASAGLSLPIIGALLGHSTRNHDARYAHLLDDPLRASD